MSIFIMVEYLEGGVFRSRAKETMVSTLRKYKKMENAYFARVSARLAAAFASLKAFLSRVKATGRQKLTILLIPHTEKKILNVQLSFFALGGILLGAGLVILAFLFSAARFSETANRLQARSSDLASTQGRLDAIRDQTSQLMTAAKRSRAPSRARSGG